MSYRQKKQLFAQQMTNLNDLSLAITKNETSPFESIEQASTSKEGSKEASVKGEEAITPGMPSMHSTLRNSPIKTSMYGT